MKFFIGYNEILIYLIELFKFLNRIINDRFTSNWKKWFGLIKCEWSESCGVSAGEDDGFHIEEIFDVLDVKIGVGCIGSAGSAVCDFLLSDVAGKSSCESSGFLTLFDYFSLFAYANVRQIYCEIEHASNFRT